MLKFVLDTNVLVSALISGKGNPALLLDKAAEKYTLFISKDMCSRMQGFLYCFRRQASS